MPVAKLHEPGPQALFVTPQENVVDLLSQGRLEQIEGLPRDEFLKRAAKVDVEFAYADADDDRERNRKDT